MSWTPTPAMLGTVRRALLTLQLHYPLSLKMAGESSEAAMSWLTSYCRAFLGRRVTLEAIEEAALRWPAEKGRKETPGPFEFAEFAERVSDEMSPQLRQVLAETQRVEQVPPPAHAKDVEAMSRRALETFRGAAIGGALWPLVTEAWGLCWKLASTDAMRDDVRLGRVPDDVWDRCISEVLHAHQRRAA